MHYRPAQILWAGRSYSLPEKPQLLLKGNITQGKKNLVLTKGDFFVFRALLQAGYRGQNYDISVSGAEKYFIYPVYRSQQGRAGVDNEILIVANKDVHINYWRDGRLYGAPAKINALIKLPDLEVEYLPPEEEDIQLIENC